MGKWEGKVSDNGQEGIGRNGGIKESNSLKAGSGKRGKGDMEGVLIFFSGAIIRTVTVCTPQ